MTRFFSVLILSTLCWSPITQAQDKLSKLELEWEKIEGASEYELELIPKFKGGEALKLKLKTTNLSRPMKEGSYDFRIRSITADNGPGPWSKPVEITVLPLMVQLHEPQDGAALGGGQNKKESVKFKWKAAKGAKRYRLRVWSKKKEKLHEFKTSKLQKNLKLKVGGTYYWEVRATGKQGERYEMSGETFRFRLLGEQLKPPVINPVALTNVDDISWKPVEKATTYNGTLYRQDLGGGPWVKVSEKKRIKSIKWEHDDNLRPGVYKVELDAHNPIMVSSDKAKREFLIKPTLADLKRARDLNL